MALCTLVCHTLTHEIMLTIITQRLMKHGPDHKSYYHELFLRGRPDLTLAMTRLNKPGKRIPDPEGEPNFYRIAELYPLPPNPDDDVAESSPDHQNSVSENAESFENQKASSKHTESLVETPSLQTKEGCIFHETDRSPDQETPSALYPHAPTLHPFHSDQHLSKRQRNERHSYPPHGYYNPHVHQPQYLYGQSPPYPYHPSPYVHATHPHFHNPYTSPERHYQHSDYQTHHQGYPYDSYSPNQHQGYYSHGNNYATTVKGNPQQWHHGYYSHGNDATERERAAEEGLDQKKISTPQFAPSEINRNYESWGHEKNVQVQLPMMNQGSYTLHSSPAVDAESRGSHTHEYSLNSPEGLHANTKPTRYIFSAKGLRPATANDAAIAQLDDRKPPARSNRPIGSASSPLQDNLDSKESTKMSDGCQLLNDTNPFDTNIFSAEGLNLAEDYDVTIAHQLNDKKPSANGSATSGSS